MSADAFHAFIQIEPPTAKKVHYDNDAILPAPQKAFPRTYHSVPETQHSSVELTNVRPPPRRHESSTSVTTSPVESHVDLEMSRPATPVEHAETFDALQSFSNPPMNRFRMLSACLITFAMGLSDSAPGALIPYIERHYNIGYAIVSLIFITNAVGFISAAFFVDAIRSRLGRAKALLFAHSLILFGYLPVVFTPPFPVIVVVFFFLGFGMAINLAIANVFVSNLQNGTKMLGFMHGSYGIGGTIGPIIATSIVSVGQPWSRYYIIPLGITFLDTIFVPWAFWHYDTESNQTLLNSATVQISLEPNPTSSSLLSDMVKVFKLKVVILGALFIFAYQGAEVSISGWVISFLITTREGSSESVGYVTSGFWAGITLGRFLLSHQAQKIGEKAFVYGIVIGAVIFELLVWFVPNVIGDAVAVSIVGLLLGPVYPCATSLFLRAIARKDQVSSLGVISAFGSSGGALAPFLTGILAQAVGTFVLHPIAIGLFLCMLGLWFFLPDTRKRTE
ncbi:major facilitator superfamily transporter [Xylogone sp. PMI_703]|nr:major facilitator superfamily transporter [Xylogone sp. PMI_703]